MRGRLTVPKDKQGRFPAKHNAGVDPRLVGPRGFEHPAVRAWHRWLLEAYAPRSRIALITPCSNVKPYTLSPTSRKIAGLLRRLGLWNSVGPHGIEWVYLSDLLVLVPYWRAWDYPACCYELHPEDVLSDKRLFSRVTALLAQAMERLSGLITDVIVFLPRRHLRIWNEAKKLASTWPREHHAKYTIFGTGELGATIKLLLGMRDKG